MRGEERGYFARVASIRGPGFQVLPPSSERSPAQRKSEAGGRFLTANQIGVYRAMSKKPRYAEYQSELMPYDTYRQASSTEIRLNLWWGIPGQGGDSNNGATFDRLQDHSVQPEAGTWTWATLPSAVKDQITAAEDKYKDRIGG